MSKRGLFIVFEGLDGAGTTTQAQELVRRLRQQGQSAHYTAEPSSGPIGSQIRLMLAGRLSGYQGGPWDRRALALLFAADRLDHLAADIEPKLAAGIHVVCDRYLLSSLAYQSLDCPLDWIETINRYAPTPDRTFFLRVPAEIALGRRQAATPGRGDLFETLPQQQRIAAHYERDLVAHGAAQRVVELDGCSEVDALAARIEIDIDALRAD